MDIQNEDTFDINLFESEDYDKMDYQIKEKELLKEYIFLETYKKGHD